MTALEILGKIFWVEVAILLALWGIWRMGKLIMRGIRNRDIDVKRNMRDYRRGKAE